MKGIQTYTGKGSAKNVSIKGTLTRQVRRYRFELRNKKGEGVFWTNLEHIAQSVAETSNLELIKHLPDVRVGRTRYDNRFTVLRKITQQIPIRYT